MEEKGRKTSFVQSFFRIILQTTMSDKKLGLPVKFVKRHGDELADFAELTVSDGRVWRVGLGQENDLILLDGGFNEFLEYYSICFGHFLVFKYNGKSSFNVEIYSTSTCEIEYPHTGPNKDKQRQLPDTVHVECDVSMKSEKVGSGCASSGIKTDNSRVVIAQKSPYTHEYETRSKRLDAIKLVVTLPDSVQVQQNVHVKTPIVCGCTSSKVNVDDSRVVGAKKSRYRMRSKFPSVKKETKLFPAKHEPVTDFDGDDQMLISRANENGIMTSTWYPRVLKKISKESKKALYAATMKKPRHPCFLVVLSLDNAHNRLVLPSAFLKKYRPARPNHIVLRDPSRRDWPVIVKWPETGLGGGVINAGWPCFSRANSLKEGDVCVFEQVKVSTYQVSFFRATSG